MSSIQHIVIVVPLFNEEHVLPKLLARLDELVTRSPERIEVLFIDDGSEDRTAVLLEQHIVGKQHYSALFLSRNFGHPQALTAGLEQAATTGADAVLIIDGDLQDPPELLASFVARLEEGYDVVYGIRKRRKEGVVKNACYKLYYRLQHRFANIRMPLDAGDFSLLSMRVVEAINAMPEESRYLRGLRSWVGFKQVGIPYERDGRVDGGTKYGIAALIRLALNGIFNFSVLPVRFIVITGMLSIGLALIYLGITIYKKLVFGTVPEGFTALIFAIVLFSGVQLLSLGIIGQYVVRIFFQVKQRPHFIVKSRITNGRVSDG